MITSFMRDVEMYEEIRKDFLEMKSIMNTTLSKFNRELRGLSSGKHMLHSIIQTKTYQTKQHNVWTIRLQDCGQQAAGPLVTCYLTYLPILHRDGRTDYLFLHNLDRFKPERLTAHFIQRYKERYLIPHNINISGTQIAVYFMYHNRERKSTSFKPIGWTEEEIEKKKFWISTHGMFVTEQNDNMRTFITFLDQENLSRYQAMVYEEENLIHSYRKLKAMKDPVELWKNIRIITQISNVEHIFERYIRRTSELKGKELEEYIQSTLKTLKELMIEGKRMDDHIVKETKTNSITDMDIIPKMNIPRLF